LEPEKWVNVFTRVLVEQGHSLKLFDIEASKARAVVERYGGEQSTSFREAVSGADLVLICATTGTVPEIISEVEPYKGPDTIVCEIASFKMKTIPALRQSGGVRPLSIHPMFGPEIASFKGETFAVVTVNDSSEESETARTLFPEAKLVQLDAETHDRCMASILSLPYFMNLAFARILAEGDLPFMRELAGPTFEVQISVTQSIVGESPDLIRSLINDNVFSWQLVERFKEEVEQLSTLFKTETQEIGRALAELKGLMRRDVGFENAREFRNLVLDSLKK
jgi:prephenate dehydrogenase